MTQVPKLTSMRAFETVHAEPRDSVESPDYRVNFWQKSGQAWALDAFVLTDVEDLTEVLRWLDENARGRRFEVFAEMDTEPARPFQTPRTSGLVRLLGRNANEGVSAVIGLFTAD